MYNFLGIVYRIWAVGGTIFLLGILIILLEKPWTIEFNINKCKFGIFCVFFSIVLSSVYLHRIVVPNISTFTGEFIEYHRDSRVAPPLPLTFSYVFDDGVDKKREFYLDVLSEKKIIEDELLIGHEYTIYYDKFTKVIVKVEAEK